MNKLRWYLLYTKPSHEDQVAKRLGDSGFEVFNPRLKERRQIRGKIKEVTGSLFPCYIFVRFNLCESLRLVKYTRGVRKVVGSDVFPTAVSDSIIETILARSEDGYVNIEPRTFKTGDNVEILGGPFAGIEALFMKELGGMERVCLLLKEISMRVVLDRALVAGV